MGKQKIWAMSAGLTKNETATSVSHKIHGGAVAADSEEAAIGAFFKTVKIKNQGWSIFDILALEIEQEVKP